MLFIISDTHFGHANIIKYCNRPFRDSAEMDAVMIERWNRVVGRDDDVLHLGDFAFKGTKNLKETVAKLNGNKFIVRGNHDPSVAVLESVGFSVVCDLGEVASYVLLHEDVEDSALIVTHRPIDMPKWSEDDQTVRLCGHEHNNAARDLVWWRDANDNAYPILTLNMSVEHWNYTPVRVGTAIAEQKALVKRVLEGNDAHLVEEANLRLKDPKWIPEKEFFEKLK